MHRQSFQDRHLFSKYSLANCGFQIATNGNLSKQLHKLIPSGKQSALYDAIIKSFLNIRNLYLMIDESGNSNNWALVIIIICSGADSCSRSNIEDVKRTYSQIKKQIKVQKLYLKIIAYNMEVFSDAVINQLSSIEPQQENVIRYASNNFGNSQNETIGNLMKQLRNIMGLRSDKEKRDLESNMHYGVHFTVAGFETNKGQAWKRICYGIQSFTKYLGDEDVVGAVTYTNKVHQFWGEQFFTTRQSISMQNLPIKAIRNEQIVLNAQRSYLQQRLLIDSNQINKSESSILGQQKQRGQGFYFITDIKGTCRKMCAVLMLLLLIVALAGCLYLIFN